VLEAYCLNKEDFLKQQKNPGAVEIFLTRSERLWGPTSFLSNGYRVFIVGKAAGAWR
jgi:hypothetical protein